MNSLDIVVVQLSGDIYYWALRQTSPYKVLASSRLIAEKYLVMNEANKLANQFGLIVSVEER